MQVKSAPLHVLLVDDDAFVLRTTASLVMHLGHRVIIADSGQKAVDTYRRHGGSIDLVVLDLHMPGLNGFETYTALRAEDPGVRVMVITADETVEARALFDAGVAGLLRKPYYPDTLQRAMLQAAGREA